MLCHIRQILQVWATKHQLLDEEKTELIQWKRIHDLPLLRVAKENDIQQLKELLEDEKCDPFQRGAVGETALHVAVQYENLEAVELLLDEAPALINQPMTSELYRGQTALHIATINQNLDLVQLLIHRGADVKSPRATGSFFALNPKNMFYFGEHILAFACCVGDAEIAKLLLDHGADLWAQDCWGNTILHILILQPNANLSCEMFDFLLSQDPEPDGKPLYEIPNGEGLTPLKLAAAEGNVVMFQHLIQKKRKIQRTYGPVTTMIYDMSEIDSWEDPQSVLQLITSSNKSEAHKILNSSPVKELLQKKWRRTGRPYVWFLGTVHTLYMICVSLSFANRPLKPLTGVKTNPMDITVAVQKTLQESYVTTEDHLRLAGEIVTLLGAVVLLLVEISQVQQFGLNRVLVHIFWSDPFHLLRMSYSIMILVVLMMRLTNTNGEVIPMSLALIFGWCYIMYFARGFQMIGPFTITIQKLFSVILVKVCCIMAVVVIGYSTALYVALQQSDPAALGSFYPFMICTISTYQLFTNILNGPANYSVDLPELYSFLYGSFCVVAFLLLFNLFLGIMGDTQNEMSKIKEEIWKAQITAASITMEQKLPKHWMFASRSEEHDLCGRHYLIVEERKWKPIKQENNDSSEESDDDDDDLPTPAEE